MQPARAFADVWADAALRQRLREDPLRALPEIGIPVPPGVRVKTVACKGAVSDVEEASLLQFLLERDGRLAYFFLPSPRSPCSQQATYGRVLSTAIDDPVFDARLRQDALAALRALGVAP